MPAIRDFTNQTERTNRDRFRNGLSDLGLYSSPAGDIFRTRSAFMSALFLDSFSQYPFQNLMQYSDISHVIKIFEGTTFSDELIDKISDLHESIYNRPLRVEYH
jgi:hypothetical protein